MAEGNQWKIFNSEEATVQFAEEGNKD